MVCWVRDSETSVLGFRVQSLGLRVEVSGFGM